MAVKGLIELYKVMKELTRPAVIVPPRKPYLSIRRVSAPLPLAATAAATPAVPFLGHARPNHMLLIFYLELPIAPSPLIEA